MTKTHLLSLLLAIALLVSTFSQMKLREQVKTLSERTISPMEATLSVIHSRKSVRHYQDKPVSKADIETLLRAAMAAPTGMDKRPWKFVAITDTSIIHQLNQDAPAAIVVCGDMQVASDKAPEFWVTDCSVATQNILLSVEAMGLGAVWKSVYPWPVYSDQVKTVLGLPDHFNPLCIIPIGYPTGVEKPKHKYDPQNIRWNRWTE